jgi:hypothetical protein
MNLIVGIHQAVPRNVKNAKISSTMKQQRRKQVGIIISLKYY